MKGYIVLIFIIILSISYFSCQEPFPLDNLDSDKKIPVVEGTITNDSGSYKILLYYAIPYNESSKNKLSITKALVYVKDDIGNIFNYEETTPGVYESDSATFLGTIGRTYTLYIEMPDGNIIKSDPEKINDPLKVKEIIKRRETREESYRDKENKIITNKTECISYYAVVDRSYENRGYYRLKSNYLVYSETMADTMFYRKVNVNNIVYEFMIDSATYSKCTGINTLDRLPVVGIYNPASADDNIELSYYYNANDYSMREDMGDKGSKSLYTFLYTISPKAYNYYKALSDQLSASTSIYDPLPTQLTGNMHCVNDSSQLVLGFFEAASVTLHKSQEFLHKIDCYDSTVIGITYIPPMPEIPTEN